MNIKQALAIKQTGARQISKDKYQLMGGVFTAKELANARLRYAKAHGIKKATKKDVGL
jgi:hypothetical protein